MGSKPKQFIIHAKHLTVQSKQSLSLYNVIVWVAGLLSNSLHECSSQHPRLLTSHPRLRSSKMKNKVVYGFCTDRNQVPIRELHHSVYQNHTSFSCKGIIQLEKVKSCGNGFCWALLFLYHSKFPKGYITIDSKRFLHMSDRVHNHCP